MSKKKKPNKLKGPLFVTVALISCYPVWVAQEAIADTSVDGSSSFAALNTALQQKLAVQRSPLGLSLPLQSKTTPSLIQTRSPYTDSYSPQDLADALDALAKAETHYEAIKNRLADLTDKIKVLNEKLSAAKDAHETATAALEEAQAQKDSATQELTRVVSIYENALAEKNSADEALTRQLQLKASAQATFDEAIAAKQAALVVLNSKESALAAALQTKNTKLAALTTAQYNYNHNLIPDPTWTAPTQQVAHTRQIATEVQVPHTTTTTTTSANILPNLVAGVWLGGGSGAQGSIPAINDNSVKFSYTQQSVTYTAQAHLTGTLNLQADTWNYDMNNGTWGQDTYSINLTTYAADGSQNGTETISVNTWHDWTVKSLSLTPTSDVYSYKVTLTGFDGGYWYGTYGPIIKNVRLAATQTTTTTTYTTETQYTTETYYTTEVVLTQGTLNVDIREGGSATFTAPAGATFTGSTLRYESYNNPQCGRNIAPNLNGLSTITIQALNSVWGDPCGGQVKHVVGTLSYLGQPTAPLIHNPELLPAVEVAQAEYDIALASYNTALTEKTSAQTSYDATAAEYTSAETNLNTATAETVAAQELLTTKSSTFDEAVAAKETATSSYEVASTEVAAAESEVQAKSAALETTNEELTTTTAAAETTHQEVIKQSTKVETLKEEVAVVEANQTKEPEEGAKEIPTDLSADNLMEVNLDSVDPTELTEEQAEQLKEAALETFETAEEGSAEYEQALDALYLAAEQDDIVLDPALAAIPGLAAATELVNFLGNAGADMSPARREESQKVVVTAVVAAGAAVQAAAGAAASAASASASSGGSRRVGK